MKKSFTKKLSLLLVVMLLVNVFAVTAVSNTSLAATKKHTVGAFTVKVPTNFSKTEQADGINEQAIFVNGSAVVLVQSTPVGMDISNDLLKSVLETTLKSMYSDNFKNLKFGTAKTGLGKAVSLKCTITNGTNSMPCRMYAVCKGESMFMLLSMGTSAKVEKKILKSAKLK